MIGTKEIKEPKVEDIRARAEENRCPVQRALFYITEFLSGPMCGRCFPCMMGSYEAQIRLRNITEGRGGEEDVAALKRIAADMLEASMCKKGKDTARFITEWLDEGVIHEHIQGKCFSHDCAALISYRIDPDRCTLCGICLEACTYHAIHGEKAKPFRSGYRPFEIRQKRCTKCDACRKACPEEAIVIIDVRDGTPGIG